MQIRKKRKKKKSKQQQEGERFEQWPMYIDPADVLSQEEVREADSRYGCWVLRKPLEYACGD